MLRRLDVSLKGYGMRAASLSEMGKDPETIRIMLGQKTDAMARHYSRRADHTARTTATIRNFGAEVDRRRTKIVKPSKKVSNLVESIA